MTIEQERCPKAPARAAEEPPRRGMPPMTHCLKQLGLHSLDRSDWHIAMHGGAFSPGRRHLCCQSQRTSVAVALALQQEKAAPDSYV